MVREALVPLQASEEIGSGEQMVKGKAKAKPKPPSDWWKPHQLSPQGSPRKTSLKGKVCVRRGTALVIHLPSRAAASPPEMCCQHR